MQDRAAIGDDGAPSAAIRSETAHNIGMMFPASQAEPQTLGGCRAELQGAPKIKNFCGPMYDGDDEQGRAVIRYESQEVYDILSC